MNEEDYFASISQDTIDLRKSNSDYIAGKKTRLMIFEPIAIVNKERITLSSDVHLYLLNSKIADEELKLLSIINKAEKRWERVGDNMRIPTSATNLIPVLDRHGLLSATKTSNNESFISYAKLVKFLKLTG